MENAVPAEDSAHGLLLLRAQFLSAPGPLVRREREASCRSLTLAGRQHREYRLSYGRKVVGAYPAGKGEKFPGKNRLFVYESADTPNLFLGNGA